MKFTAGLKIAALALLLLPSIAIAEGPGDKVIGLNATGVAGIEQWGVTLNAKHITLRNPTDGTTFDIHSPAATTVFMSAASAAFADLHIYYIWGATSGLAGTIQTGDPAVGPVLPDGYTNYAYAYSVRANCDGQMYPSIHARGHEVFFNGFPNQTVWNWLPPGSGPTSATNVQIWNWVPDQAITSTIWWDAEVLTSGTVNIDFVVLTQAPFSFQITGAQRVAQNFVLTTPTNSGMYVPVQFYSGSYAGVSSLFLGFQILSYTIANGG